MKVATRSRLTPSLINFKLFKILMFKIFKIFSTRVAIAYMQLLFLFARGMRILKK